MNIQNLNHSIENFLIHYVAPADSIGVALSGGPDSRALLELLLPFKRELFQQLHVIHIDHQWRAISAQEAKELELLAKEKQIPFHLKTLDLHSKRGNLEEVAREGRRQFFCNIQKQESLVGVFLGHHADDQSETVIKRLFEGASLINCQGIREKTTQKNLTLFRPLLNISKNQIVSWLEKKKIPYFTDPTNLDPLLLRGKMRTHLIPFLSDQFGKNIQSSILHLSEQCAELEDYVAKCLLPSCCIEKGIGGVFIDLSEKNRHPFEVRTLIKEMCNRYSLSISYDQMQGVISGYKEKKAHRFYGDLYLDRQRIFFGKKWDSFPSLPEKKHPLSLGKTVWGPWSFQVDLVYEYSDCPRSHWQQVWKGSFSFFLREGEYTVSRGNSAQTFQGKSIGRNRTEHSVPALLRKIAPVFLEKGEVVFDPLSGKSQKFQGDIDVKRWLKVAVVFNSN